MKIYSPDCPSLHDAGNHFRRIFIRVPGRGDDVRGTLCSKELHTSAAKKNPATAAIAIPVRGTRCENDGPAWHRLTTRRAHGSSRIFHGAPHPGRCCSLRFFAAAEDVFASANDGSGGAPGPRLSSGRHGGVGDARGARTTSMIFFGRPSAFPSMHSRPFFGTPSIFRAFTRNARLRERTGDGMAELKIR
ncbi:hypothetical protein MRX96_014587 [Rhipicephalus microplus]